MNIAQELIELIATSFKKDIDKIQNAKSWGDLGLDSLDTVELMMAIEDKFSIIIDDEESASLVDLDSVVNLVQSKLKGK